MNVGRGIGEGSADVTRRMSMTFHSAQGVVHDTVCHNSDLFHDAYTMAHFAECVRDGMSPDCTGEVGVPDLCFSHGDQEHPPKLSQPIPGRCLHVQNP